MKDVILFLVACVTAAVLMSGCASSPAKPIRAHKGFTPDMMDTVYVLPVIDARADKGARLDLEGLQKKMERKMKKKRYNTVLVENTAATGSLTEEDLKEKPADVLKAAGPAEARWMMVLVLGELSKKITFGSTGNAEVKLVIIDKQAGTVVWEDKALGQAGQGGVVGILMVSMMDNEALSNAVGQVMSKFPKKEKARL